MPKCTFTATADLQTMPDGTVVLTANGTATASARRDAGMPGIAYGALVQATCERELELGFYVDGDYDFEFRAEGTGPSFYTMELREGSRIACLTQSGGRFRCVDGGIEATSDPLEITTGTLGEGQYMVVAHWSASVCRGVFGGCGGIRSGRGAQRAGPGRDRQPHIDPDAGGVSAALYDGTSPKLVAGVIAPGGGTCAGKPCWKPTGTKGFEQKAKELTPSGVQNMKLKTPSSRPGRRLTG